MKKILFFILLTNYALFANPLPHSMSSTVKAISNDGITLSANISAGRSGIIVHNYGNGLLAITHTAISLGNGRASVQSYTAITHKNIPSVQTAVAVNDKVIFGNFYNNALLIAPNQSTYQKITQKYKRTWIHPDAFALSFMENDETSLTMDRLHDFAKENQVGLVLVVTQDKILVIDPISKVVIANAALPSNLGKPITPFYARFNQMNVSIFDFSDRHYTPYFQSVAGLQ